MKVYFKFLGMGELPGLRVSDHRVLTIQDHKAATARRWDDDKIVYAHENRYIERRPGWTWWQHPIDMALEIEQWVDRPEVATLREGIRGPLMQDVRLLQTKSCIVYVRTYHVVDGLEAAAVEFVAGVLGFSTFDPSLLDFTIAGPSWEFETERFVDSVISGASIPEGVTRYGITPRGKILNPLPPVCQECGERHYSHVHKTESPGSFANALDDFRKRGVPF